MTRLGGESKIEWIADLIEEREEIVHGQKVMVKVYSAPKAYINGELVDDLYYSKED